MLSRLLVLSLLMFCCFFQNVTKAEIIIISFEDEIGDNASTIDLKRLDFAFDNETGYYEAILVTSPDSVFWGSFRINVHIFNNNIGKNDFNAGRFQDTLNDYIITTPNVTAILLKGFDMGLLDWRKAHKITTGNSGRTGVIRWDAPDYPSGCLEDQIMYPIEGFQTCTPVSQIPEPSAIAILIAGMLALGTRNQRLSKRNKFTC